MSGTTFPKKPPTERASASMHGTGSRKGHYTATPPADALPGFPSPAKKTRSITQSNVIVPLSSAATVPPELARQLNNGARPEVAALERWTHEQLANIHHQHTTLSGVTNKEQQSAEQIKVLDTSAELLAKMVEVHCIDKANLLRKLWASSGDLFQTIYTELATVVHDLKLSVAEKSLMCAKLEDTIDRLRESMLPHHLTRSDTAATTTTSGAAVPEHSQEAGRLSEHDAEQYRAVQQELLLKNKEMLELQDTLTSLAVWFPHFAKFNGSVLSKYLPPIDYLEQLEEQRLEEERKALEAQRKKEEEARQQQMMTSMQSSKSGKLARGLSTLSAIGEDSKPGEPTAAPEEDLVEVAQNYLLKDLKRLQGLGIGFAVLDPTEYEACKAVLAGNMTLATSAGVFGPSQAAAAAAAGTMKTSDTGRKAMISSAAGQPVPVPAVLTAALSRTSVAVRNKFRNRSGKIQSFVEVQGDEYVLGAPRQEQSNADDDEGFGLANEEGEGQEHAGNAVAAAAAAVRRMFETDTPASASTSPLHVGTSAGTGTADSVVPPSPNVSDFNVSDYYKMQNARVSVVDPDDAAGAVARLAADLSQKRKPNYYEKMEALRQQEQQEQRRKRAGPGAETPAEAEDADHDDEKGVTEAEYELKYRALMLDAQRLEVAKAGLEKKIKEEQKAHNKQLLRMSAQITTLQNKLTQSTLSTSALLAKLPHVVFAPMIPRGTSMRLPQHAVTGTSSRLKTAGSRGAGGNTGFSPSRAASFGVDDAESALFGDSLGDPVSVLLNNAPGHRVKFNPRSELQEETVDSFTAELGRLSISEPGGVATGGLTAVGSLSPALPPLSVASGIPHWGLASAEGSYLTIAEIERVVARFCAHFVQPAPFIPHTDGKPTDVGMSARDELFASFGQGVDQWTHSSLSSCLNGQQAGLFAVLSLDTAAGVSSKDMSLVTVLCEVDAILQDNVFAVHLFQFLSTYGGAGLPGASASAVMLRHRKHHPDRIRCVAAVHQLHRVHRSAVQLLQSAFNPLEPVAEGSPHHALLLCLSELFGYPHIPAGSSINTGSGPGAQGAGLSHPLCGLIDPQQRHLRGCVSFDIFLHCFRAMQRYLPPAGTARSFPVSLTESLLRRVFVIVGEEGPSSASTGGTGGGGGKKDRAVDKAQEAQSPPWWRCLSQRALAALKHDTEMTTVNAHRAVAVRKILSLNRGAPVAEVKNLEEEGQTEELRVDCYECVVQCLRAAERTHARLMQVLMHMYRYLESLSIHGGCSNRSFHLLLAHFLQQGYPSVQEVGAGFSISAIASGNFSFAPKTAIVVNLQLMTELQALAASGSLSAATFADAVLRSQPNYLVHSLLPLLEPTAQQMAAVRDKLISDGSGHLFSLKQMIQRAYQQRLTEHRAANGGAAGMAAGGADAASAGVAKAPGGSPAGVRGTPRSKHGKQTAASAETETSVPTSHFKQSYLINKLLFPVETDVVTAHSASAPVPHSASTAADPTEEDAFLLREMVDYAEVLGITHAELFANHRLLGEEVVFNPFVERLLLHGKLSYDENITGVMAPSLAEVALTTWSLQYAVETLSRLRGSSMRLKSLFKRDMRDFTYTAPPTDASPPKHSKGSVVSSVRNNKIAQTKARSQSNLQSDIGSIGDYILTDFLLGDVDMDTFVKVEAHYMCTLQRRVFRAWNAVVEDRTGQFK